MRDHRNREDFFLKKLGKKLKQFDNWTAEQLGKVGIADPRTQSPVQNVVKGIKVAAPLGAAIGTGLVAAPAIAAGGVGAGVDTVKKLADNAKKLADSPIGKQIKQAVPKVQSVITSAQNTIANVKQTRDNMKESGIVIGSNVLDNTGTQNAMASMKVPEINPLMIVGIILLVVAVFAFK